MTSSLKLVNLNDGASTPHPLPHDFLPNPSTCFRMIVFAPSNSGKSNLIKNILTRSEFGYNSYYGKNIFLFSQTIHIDPIWKDINLPATHKYENWDDNIVNNLMHFSKCREKGVLIVLDDMITSKEAINNKQSNLLKKLFYQGRHYKVSLILVSQKMKDIPVGMRTNATQLICFNLRNSQEENGFFFENEYIDGIKQKYAIATSQKYNFLYLNKVTNKVYHNFEKELK